MLTSCDLDQRSAKFGSVSNSSEWCFLLKFGRCKTATFMNHADFLRISHVSASSLVHSYKIWLMIPPPNSFIYHVTIFYEYSSKRSSSLFHWQKMIDPKRDNKATIETYLVCLIHTCCCCCCIVVLRPR